MIDPPLPTSGAFRRGVIGFSFLLSLPALAIVIACLLSLLELTGEQWTWFFWWTGVWGVVVTPPMAAMQRRFMAPIATYLDRRAAGGASQPERREAFAAIVALPRKAGWFNGGGWVVPVVVVSLAMALRYDEWGAFEGAVLHLAGLAAGFVAGTFAFFLVKRFCARVRNALTREIPDPAERRTLVRAMSLRAKLLVCVTGVTLVPVVFTVMLAQTKAERSVEQFTLRWQQRVLDALVEQRAHEDLGRARRAVLGDAVGAASLDVAVVDLAGARASRTGLAPNVLEHLRAEIAGGAVRGNSAHLPTREVFAWRRLPGGELLLARTPKRELQAGATRLGMIFAALLLFSMGIAFGLAYLLSQDVSEATESLRGEAERMASGDLRRGRVFESEDELGELARSFEGMARSLRATVSRVAQAADRVEATAAEMASVSESVAAVTADQVQGIEQTTASMEAINTQVGGIANSSQALNVSVEESSSSILELGTAGGDLKETASVLSAKVEEMSSSIEQMVHSVRRVSENTEELSEASVQTSASMEEMANSLREVDASAEETARLSHQVVCSAERGQVKVRETISGMEAIREATETAERVIRHLGARTKEIGAIVNVIDDVADETNLLALNAAIIAAQAGEHGRAFSVVADEIKDLADRTLSSTKEIGGLIAALQGEGTNAIGAIEQGTRSVASGVELSAEAGVSLEEITRASRESGTRMAGIVAAVREQAKAASHVVDLMERVRAGVDQIREASLEQDRGDEVIHCGSVAMRAVTQQVRRTTEEQARGSGRIRESFEEVREAVEQINGALQEQSASCRSAVEFLSAMSSRTRAGEDAARRMDDAAKELLHQAEGLREEVQRFRV